MHFTASAIAPCTIWYFFSHALTILSSTLTSAPHSSQLENEQTLEKYIPKFIQKEN